MTLAQVQALRDKYYNALLDGNITMPSHSIDAAWYDHTRHLEALQKAFAYWDNLYNIKSTGGAGVRLAIKAV